MSTVKIKVAQATNIQLNWLAATALGKKIWMRCFVASKLGDEVEIPEELSPYPDQYPYFASEASGSMQHEQDLAAGYVMPGQIYYQLQKNDELGVITSDDEAVRQCIRDAAAGDAYAIEQLALAQTDGLVRRTQEELK